MTTPRSYADDVPPTITLDGDAAIRTSAGSAVGGRAYVTNRAPEPRIMAVAFLGVDADWLPDQTRSRVLMPGETVPMDFTLHPAVGTLAARYPFAVTAQAIDPASGQAMSSAAIADYALVVDAPGRVEVQVVPNELTRRVRGKVSIRVTNVGNTPENVRIEVNAPDNVSFALESDQVVVQPGGSATVPARLAIDPQTFGRPTRYSYTVTARGRGAARRVDAAVTTRAILGNTAPKFFALIAIVALWAGLAFTFIPTIVNKVNDSGSSAQDDAANAQDRALDKLRKTQTATPKPGSGGSGSGGSGSGGSGSGGSGSGGSGSGGSGSGGSGSGSGGSGSGGSGSGGASAASDGTAQFSGTVTGASPSGVTVAMRPTSLIASEAQSAKGIGVNIESSRALGKIPEQALTTAAPTVSDDGTTAQSVVTKTDGGWGFARVRAPGYYLVTFSKPGFQSQSFVLDAASAAAAEPMKVNLLPGPGTLQGSVSGPDGAVGSATVTVTDGTTTLTSSTNSTTDKGAWRIAGLSAPASYLVTVSKDGLGTSSKIVDLSAKGTATVDLTMSQNSYTLTGKVGLTGSADKLGGATVTATSVDADAASTIVRTSTSVTTGSLRGTYYLPDLPRGDYVVATQATGYLTQSVRISIPGRLEVNPELAPSSANVSGRIKRYRLDKNGNELTNAKLVNLGGAGVTLSSDTNKYKITADDGGAFDFSGVVPGTYTLSAEYAGYRTSYLSVEASLDGTTPNPANLTLPIETVSNDGSITGLVSGGNNPGGTVLCPDQTPALKPGDAGCQIKLTLRDSAGNEIPTRQEKESTDKYEAPTIVTPADSGPTTYTLFGDGGLEPGLYKLTVGADGYLPVTVNVRVGTGVSTAPPAALYRANSIVGTLRDMLGDIRTDKPSTNPTPVVTCVWAFPQGQQRVPTDCTAPTDKNADGTDNRNFGSCQREGRAEPAVAKIGAEDPTDAPFTYRIPGLCDGTYYLYAYTNNHWYLNSDEIRTLNLSQGRTEDFNPHIVRKGVVRLNMTSVDPDTGLATGSGGLTGTANCGTTNESAGSFAASDTGVNVFGVDGNLSPQTCTVNATGNGETYSGRVTNVYANNDATVSRSVVLTPELSSITGRLISSYKTSSANSVANATLSVTVSAGYDGTVPGQSVTKTVVTDAKGCFAVRGVDKPLPQGSGECAGRFTTSNTTTLSAALSSRKVTIDWNGTTAGNAVNSFLPLSNFAQNLGSATTTDVTVLATPVSTSGKVTVTAVNGTAANNTADLNSAKIQVTHVDGNGKDTAAGADSVTGSVDAEDPQNDNSRSVSFADNTIASDSRYPTHNDVLSPGSYQLKVSLDGYADATGTLICELRSDSSTACGTVSLVLTRKGGLSGTIRGILGASQTYTGPNGATEYPSNKLENARVTITCTDATQCHTSTAAALTGADGTFTFDQGGQQYTLEPGPYSYTLTSPSAGYQSVTTGLSVTIESGNIASLSRDYLLATTLTLNIGIKTNDTTFYKCSTSNKCSVTITRTVTGAVTSPQKYEEQCVDAATPCAKGFRYVFPDVVPGDYTVAISGDELTTSNPQLTVNPTGQTTNYDPVVGTTSNTVQGSVVGPDGKTGTKALNGITVQLGSYTDVNDPTTFKVAKASDGTTDLSTTTPGPEGVAGTFTLKKVPPGRTYVIRYTDTNPGTRPGYQSVDEVTPTVAGAIILPKESLLRVSQTVSVSIKTTGSPGDVSGSTVKLTAPDDPTWTFENPAAPPAGVAANGTYTWTFQNVPSGKWKPSITLPANHFGELTGGTPGLTCPAGSTTNTVSCTSGTGTFTVSGSTTATPSNLSYDLKENKLVFSVLADPLDTDPNADPPDTVKLELKGDGNTVYSNATFSVQQTITGNPVTDFIWGRSGTTYKSTVTSDVSNWTSATADLPGSGQIKLSEQGSTVTVKVTGLPVGATGATVSLVVPTDSGVTGLDTPTVTRLAPSADISDVPYYDGYKASVTYKKADGTTVTKTNTTATDVNGATESATVSAV